MTGPIESPDVYIAEGKAFPKSVAAVATAVPAFVGYTEKPDGPEQADFTAAGRDGKSAGYTLRQADGKDGGCYLLLSSARCWIIAAMR